MSLLQASFPAKLLYVFHISPFHTTYYIVKLIVLIQYDEAIGTVKKREQNLYRYLKVRVVTAIAIPDLQGVKHQLHSLIHET
jgi:hypothetical protein